MLHLFDLNRVHFRCSLLDSFESRGHSGDEHVSLRGEWRDYSLIATAQQGFFFFFFRVGGSMGTYLEPSGNFLSKDVLRGMAAW